MENDTYYAESLAAVGPLGNEDLENIHLIQVRITHDERKAQQNRIFPQKMVSWQKNSLKSRYLKTNFTLWTGVMSQTSMANVFVIPLCLKWVQPVFLLWKPWDILPIHYPMASTVQRWDIPTCG